MDVDILSLIPDSLRSEITWKKHGWLSGVNENAVYGWKIYLSRRTTQEERKALRMLALNSAVRYGLDLMERLPLPPHKGDRYGCWEVGR